MTTGLNRHHEDADDTLRRMPVGSVHNEEIGLFLPVVRSEENIFRQSTQGVGETAIAAFEQSTIGSIRLDDYAQWAWLNWKEPHFTQASAKRAVDKSLEEAREFYKEYSKGAEATKEELISELGDTLWTFTAMATLMGIDTQRAVAHALLDEQGEASLTVTIGEIDTLIANGLRPRFLNSLANDEDTLHGELNPKLLLYYAVNMERYLFDTYHLEEEAELLSVPPPFSMFDTSPFGVAYGKSVLFMAYYAHHLADSSLEEVISHNIRKINNRVATNTIDKTDGQRNE